MMPLVPFTLTWLMGIWCASRTPTLAGASVALSTAVLRVAAGAAIVGIILTWRTPKPRWFFIFALAAILGALRINLAQPYLDQTTLATRSANDQPMAVIVEGVVVSEPDVRDTLTHTNLRVEANKLIITDQPTKTVRGLVLIQAPPFSD